MEGELMQKIDWEMLLNYLDGSASADEKKHIEEWIDADNENKKYLERVKKIWNTPPSNFPKPDTEEALKKVLAKIENPERLTKIYRLDSTQHGKTYFQILTQSNFLRAAAAIVIIVGAAYLMTNIFSKKDSALVHITTNNIQELTLSDGTKVTLDTGSSFEYPENFSGADNREVKLNGEAYFEVVRNEDAPFIVNANDGLIKVLDTKFNIRAWEKSNEVIVAVAEGKVSLQKKTEPEKSGVVLTEGKMSMLTQEGELTEPIDVDLSQYLSWLNGEIYFQNTPLIDVIEQLERWNNTNIELQDSTLLNNRVTVFIENKPLEENLKLICMLMNLKYEIKGDAVKLMPNEENYN